MWFEVISIYLDSTRSHVCVGMAMHYLQVAYNSRSIPFRAHISRKNTAGYHSQSAAIHLRRRVVHAYCFSYRRSLPPFNLQFYSDNIFHTKHARTTYLCIYARMSLPHASRMYVLPFQYLSFMMAFRHPDFHVCRSWRNNKLNRRHLFAGLLWAQCARHMTP